MAAGVEKEGGEYVGLTIAAGPAQQEQIADTLEHDAQVVSNTQLEEMAVASARRSRRVSRPRGVGHDLPDVDPLVQRLPARAGLGGDVGR